MHSLRFLLSHSGHLYNPYYFFLPFAMSHLSIFGVEPLHDEWSQTKKSPGTAIFCSGLYLFLCPGYLACCGNHDVERPYYGQHSFLRNFITEQVETKVCQCPRTGNTHFYCTLSKPFILCGSLTLLLRIIYRIF